MIRTSLFNVYLAIFTVFCYFHIVFVHPINPKGLVVFYIFQGLIHIFKDNFTKFQDNRHFPQIPGVFQDKVKFKDFFKSVRTLSDVFVVHLLTFFKIHFFPKISFSNNALSRINPLYAV